MKTKLILPAIVYKDEDSDYGVHFLKIGGMFSSGETLEGALADAKSSIEDGLLWMNSELSIAQDYDGFVGMFPVEVEIDFPEKENVDKKE